LNQLRWSAPEATKYSGEVFENPVAAWLSVHDWVAQAPDVLVTAHLAMVVPLADP
jgi:hypothetical protein